MNEDIHFKNNIKHQFNEIQFIYTLNVISNLIGAICLIVMAIIAIMPYSYLSSSLLWVLKILFLCFLFATWIILSKLRKFRKCINIKAIVIFLFCILSIVFFQEVLQLHITIFYLTLSFFFFYPAYLTKNISEKYKNVKLQRVIIEIEE
ncbi:MAG: hypothetical protein ACOWWR_06550 [Eubacteriales bacterium]